MNISLTINGKLGDHPIYPGEILLNLLRRLGYFGVKSGGCSKGECGACTVLLNGMPINSCCTLAAQVDGNEITTIESLGEAEQQGWRKTTGLHILQKAFVQNGAVQCGYCTPAMLLEANRLLETTDNPTEIEIRTALSSVLCRCTGYLKPVNAIKDASAMLRGEIPIPPISNGFEDLFSPSTYPSDTYPSDYEGIDQGSDKETMVIKKTQVDSTTQPWQHIGKAAPKVDAEKLVQGKPAFTSDMEMRGMLFAKVLRSPHAHARIITINTSEAKRLPGVVAILTWQDIPRVIYSTAGQSDPIPGPLDAFSLDNKVRFVGDRVAFVAAETEEIAEKAVNLIQVHYEPLPSILDPEKAFLQDAIQIHDEPEYVNFGESDPSKNLAARIRIDIGNVEEGFKQAEIVFEEDYEVPKVQQAHIEPHVVITYWDENDRLTVRSSTQVPFHARRILAPLLGLPVKRIRVIKPRIGGGFGNKQEVLVEDVAAHLTIATGRPVKYEFTREEEFIASRSRHPMKIHLKTGVKRDGTITANEMTVLADTGAYGCHSLTVTGNTGHKAMALYVGDGPYRQKPNIRFYADIVYTNHPPSGAYRGYGVPQGFWAVERQMDMIARKLGLDPLEFRLKNAVRQGELHPFSTAWSEGREPMPEVIHTVGLEECVQQGKALFGWDKKYNNPQWHIQTGKPYLRRGIGAALAMHGTAIPYLDMGGASIKMNDDGSFNLLVGATDLGTGSDTVLAQMAAEVLGVDVDNVIVYSSDTDFTPFDKGAYASSTTYISGTAVINAAKQVAEKIKQRAASLIGVSTEEIVLRDNSAFTSDGRSISMEKIALASLHHANQEQFMAVASYVSPSSPPPFAAQFAEITLDIETGQIKVDRLLLAVDAGTIVNPQTASGQLEGGMSQALGYALCEEMTYDENGVPKERDFEDYHIFRADEMPEMQTLFIQTYEPTHPFGVKAIAEIPLDGVAPAIGNAIYDAIGAKVTRIPATPERVWEAIQSNAE